MRDLQLIATGYHYEYVSDYIAASLSRQVSKQGFGRDVNICTLSRKTGESGPTAFVAAYSIQVQAWSASHASSGESLLRFSIIAR